MEIELLADHIGLVDTLVDWYRQEWEPYYGSRGPGDARADLVSRCKRDELPIGLVALEGNSICGTAALDRDATTGLTPSVVGLLVARDHRGKGIADALVDAAERLALGLRYDELFISTAVLGEMLVRKGWSERGEVDFLNNERGRVYVCSLVARRKT
jgi:GNAT superfamily N-acetyltransferase